MTTTRPLETGWLPDTPVGDNLLRAFLHNQGRLNELTAAAKPRGRTARTDSVFLADAGSAVPYFNQAIPTRPLSGPGDTVLDEAEAFFGPGTRSHTLLSVWPTPDLAPRGWHLAGHPALVVRGPAPLPAREAPGVEVRQVSDAAGLAAAERLFGEAYPVPEVAAAPPGSEFPAALLGSALTVRHGLLHGAPVAVGMGHAADGVLNLCGGATLPAARRRGVWESLVRARVADAPDLPAMAYTSDYSRPGFIRMGFLPILRCTLWIRTA